MHHLQMAESRATLDSKKSRGDVIQINDPLIGLQFLLVFCSVVYIDILYRRQYLMRRAFLGM